MSAVSPQAKANARAYNREYMRHKRAERPALVREIHERWKAKNPEKAARVHRESVARWRARNPDKARQISRKANGVPEPTRPCPPACELCAKLFTRTAHVDHDHDTGAFRGWLCSNCNTGLGMFRDDATLMRAAARWVQQ